MSTRGTALIAAMRGSLEAVASLPASRRWDNTNYEPVPGTPWVRDQLRVMRTETRECGPGAWKRSTVSYRVDVLVPRHTDVHLAHNIIADIVDTFTAASITVAGVAFVVEEARADGEYDEDDWHAVSVVITGNYDHP